MKIIDKSCKEFVEVLSTATPVPGGGGASALVGAIGVALGNMVGSLTVGKKKYADVEEDIKALMSKATVLQNKLLEMVERDAEVFELLVKAYKMPKSTPTEVAEKEKVMERELCNASSVPIEIMKLASDALTVIKDFSKKGSRMAISDAGVAVVCCRAAVSGASLNVFINTKSMKDREKAQELNKYAEMLIVKANALADEVFSCVKEKLV